VRVACFTASLHLTTAPHDNDDDDGDSAPPPAVPCASLVQEVRPCFSPLSHSHTQPPTRLPAL